MLSPRPIESRFTGKERDSETNLDYFGARYYGSTMGRWMSPDWSATPQAVPYAELADPQSLNLYGYVRDNPISKFDRDGHACPPCVEEGVDLLVDYATKHPEEVAAVLAATERASVAAGEAAAATGRFAMTTLAVPLLVTTYLISPGSGGANESNDTINKGVVPPKGANQDSKEAGPDPAPASGGSGKGVRGGGKDRSLDGSIDQLDGVERHQQDATKKKGYRISTEKSKQNLKKNLKDIKKLEDVEKP